MSLLLATAFLVTQTKGGYHPTGPKIEVLLDGGKKFVITTDQKNYPKTVAGINKLIKDGFYNGIRFHRVEPWVVQWGDPVTKKTMNDPTIGSNGSGKALPFEGGPASFTRGTVGIASTGTKVGGDSQLFVITRDATHLNGNYAALGVVTSGMDVVDKIQIGTKVVKMRVLGGKKK